MFDSLIPHLASVVGSRSGPQETGEAPTTVSPGTDRLDERVERARNAVGIDADAADDGGDPFDVSAVDLERYYPDSTAGQALAQQARNRSKVNEQPIDLDRARRVTSAAGQLAEAHVPPSSYVASFVPLFEEAVERAFDEIRAGESPDDVETSLRATMRAAMVDAQLGVDEFITEGAADAPADERTSSVLTTRTLIEALPYSAFLIDDENTVLEYNSNINEQLGLESGHREYIGLDCRDTIAAATYTDDSRHKTLADKIVETPHDPEAHWDIERLDDDFEFDDGPVYGDSSVSVNTRGEAVHIEFLAIPMFDDSGQLLAVLELIEDRSADVRHEQAITDLVTAITDTLERIGEGDLSARAEYEDEYGVVSEELLSVTDEVNEMAESFEALVGRVEEKTDALSVSIDRAADSAHAIDERVDAQHEALEEVSTEMESFSATMEEVATSSSEVATAAEDALESVESGVESGKNAREATDDVREISARLVNSVTELDDRMQEIEHVVEIISDVADQTNILALNANIEAARVDAGGDGFAVVAEEVKTLANETQEHTKEIGDLVEAIQGQTDETVSEVKRAHERIEATDERIDRALSALSDVSTSVDDAAAGINEVARANDEQASTVEEVTATVDSVRGNAREVASETDEIVEEAETQTVAIDELTAQVERLTSGDDRPAR